MGEREVVLKTPAEPTETRGHSPYEPVARRKLGAPPEWKAYDWRLLESGDTLLTGGIPNDGPRNRRWRGVSPQRAVVTKEESDAELARFERETGKCHGCGGCGECVASVGVVEKPGTSILDGKFQRGVARYRIRTCSRCGGSGKAVVAEGAANA